MKITLWGISNINKKVLKGGESHRRHETDLKRQEVCKEGGIRTRIGRQSLKESRGPQILEIKLSD